MAWRTSTWRRFHRAGLRSCRGTDVDGKATLLRRHGDHRRLATLLATTVYLTTRAVDGALDLPEVLVGTKLLARSER